MQKAMKWSLCPIPVSKLPGLPHVSSQLPSEALDLVTFIDTPATCLWTLDQSTVIEVGSFEVMGDPVSFDTLREVNAVVFYTTLESVDGEDWTAMNPIESNAAPVSFFWLQNTGMNSAQRVQLSTRIGPSGLTYARLM